MLNLLEGGFFSRREEAVIEKIKSRVDSGKKTLLLVPEQQTVLTEKKMAAVLPPSAPLYFEATNFTRFADSVFRTLGGVGGEFADEGQKALVMWKVLTELTPFTEGAPQNVSAGAVKKALGEIGEATALSLTPELLDSAAKILGNENNKEERRLISKLERLSYLMTLYKKYLSEHFSDSDDTLLHLTEKLSSAPRDTFSGVEVFIDGFTSFTEPQYRVIEALLKKCEITVSLNLPKENPDAIEYREIRDAHERLQRCANKAGCDTTLTRLTSTEGNTRPLIKELCNLLWRQGLKIDCDALSDCDALALYEAKTPYDECDFVAADIKRRVMAGAKYSDFGIIARNIDSYSGILDVSFEKANIPLFMSRRVKATTFDVIKLIYSALGAVTGSFERRDVIAFAKCSLSGISREEADEFEIFVEKWQINGSRFTDGVFWNMNPEGYSDKRNDATDAKLRLLNATREKIAGPLMRLKRSLEEKEDIISHATGLWRFIEELQLEEQIRARINRYKAENKLERASELSGIWENLCASLDSMCKVLDGVKITPKSFKALLAIVMDCTDIGRIPAYLDNVSAGSAATARFGEKKRIYVIGANFGVLPGAVGDSKLFSDRERAALKKAELDISPEEDISFSRELYYLTRSLSFAKEGVSILYHTSGSDYSAAAPSDIISKISDMTGGAASVVKIEELPYMERTYSPEFALEHLYDFGGEGYAMAQALDEVGFGERLSISGQPVSNEKITLSEDVAGILYKDAIALTQSRIDRFVGCPLNYFCSYTLKLKPESRAEFDAANIGTFIHDLLERFLKTLNERGSKISEITEEEKQELISESADKYIKACFEGIPRTSARLDATVKRLCRAAKPVVDGLCEEFSDSGFEPVFFELPIKRGSDGNPTPAVFKTSDGRDVYIYGIIDRVDTYRGDEGLYVRVVDYKTGSKEFSPEDLAKGENLQMFLYLKSIVETEDSAFRDKIGLSEGEKMIPAGVIYMKTGVGDGKIKTMDDTLARADVMSRQKRLGMVLSEEESLSAMNKRFTPLKYDEINDSLITEGSKYLYTSSGWDKINETITSAIRDIADRMISGEISPTPSGRKGHNPCEYCDYKAFCRSGK